MYAYLKGTLARLEPTRAWVDVNGLGWDLTISLATYEAWKGQTGPVLAYLHPVLKDELVWYHAFATEAERDAFGILTKVSGVGAATALNLLARYAPAELIEVIEQGDVDRLQAVKGVGAKTAGRLVLEFKGKLPALQRTMASSMGQAAPNPSQEALVALVQLGLPRADAQKRLEKARNQAEGPLSVEALIRAALAQVG